MNDEDFIKELREAFAIEADEHLRAIIDGLLELEKKPEPDVRRELVERTFREAHSLKGAARAVNRSDVEAVCQELETVFSAWKKGGAEPSTETFDTLNNAADIVGKLLTYPDVSAAPADRAAIVEIVKQLAHPESAPSPPARAPAPLPAPLPARPPVAPPPPAAPSPSREEPPPTPETPHTFAETVRIPMAKMDALLLRAEEMLGVKLAANQHADALRELRGLLETWHSEWGRVHSARASAPDTAKASLFLDWNHDFMSALQEKIGAATKVAEADERAIATSVDDLLDDAKKLVMLPFGSLLDLFPKQVRDLARDEGKQVEPILRGREVEIDKRILEEMKDPLIHLVRNAIGHGIESPADRVARGKSKSGTLTIVVTQREGSTVEIVVLDDGGGIDVEKVKLAAVKSGSVSAEEASHLDDEDALQLVFQSGISTSPIITGLSGRGLGMAIVREKVERLGGHIAIGTRLGVGSSFRILLPVTLATFKGVLIRAAGQQFVIPIASLQRITRAKSTDIKTVEGRETIDFEGHPLALARLDELLELPRRPGAVTDDLLEIAVLGVGERRIGFVVEEVLNEQEVLVKKLSKPLVRVRNVSAATVLGTGTPVLILNVADLLKSAVKGAGAATRKVAAAESGAPKRKGRILVTDDSVTSRMLLKNILESSGYQVSTAMDGIDALTTLKRGDFDLVVSDVEMPRMDGFQLTKKIRADKELADKPVILVTALATREHQERGIDAGANAYIIKGSFDQSNLLEVVRRLI